MADIINFNYTVEDCLNIARKADAEGDTLKRVEFLRRALALDPACHDASIQLAEIYTHISTPAMSSIVLFKALALHPDDDIRMRMFALLATNYALEGNIEVAEYYAQEYDDDILDVPHHDEDEADLCVVRGEEYYASLVERGYDLLHSMKFDEALETFQSVDRHSKSKEEANQAILVCYMLRNDLDSVIESAKRMLSEDGDSVVIKCALATAYTMEDEREKAMEVVRDLTKTEDYPADDILLILPVLINLDLHEEVVRYSAKMMKERPQPGAQKWHAIGLYNLGRKEEAIREMREMNILYGEYSNASFYVEYFKTGPEKVEYSSHLPKEERLSRIKQIEQYLNMSHPRLASLLERIELGKESPSPTIDLLKWALLSGPDKLRVDVICKLSPVILPIVDKLFKETMLRAGLSFEMIMYLIIHFLDGQQQTVDLDLVAQDRFKSVRIYVPFALRQTTSLFQAAVRVCMAEIIYTDEEPNNYLYRLFRVINGMINVDEEGNIVYRNKKMQKIAKLRSMRTVAGALLAKVYEGEESREDMLDRYNLNPRTFDKYYDLFFGEDNDGGEE